MNTSTSTMRTMTFEQAMPTLLEAERALRRACLPYDPREWKPEDMPAIEAALHLARERRIRRLVNRGYSRP